MKSRSTYVLVVANGLLRQTLVLCSLDVLLQNRYRLVLGLKVRAKLLSIGLVGGRESVQKCLRVELVIGSVLINTIRDARAPATTASAGN